MKHCTRLAVLALVLIGVGSPWFSGIATAEVPGQGTLTVIEPDGKSGGVARWG